MLFEKDDKVLFIGDSISDYDRARPAGEVPFNGWGTSYVSCVGALLTCAAPQLGLRIVNMGVSGNNVRDLDARWQTDVLDQRPQWVSVLIGINDVWRQFDCPTMKETHVPPEEYREVYDSLIRRTLPSVKGMILMTPYFMEPHRGDAMRARMDEYGTIVKELAEKYKLPCVDLQAAWDKLFEHMHPMSISWDRVHPNQIGCMYIARAFLKATGFEW